MILWTTFFAFRRDSEVLKGTAKTEGVRVGVYAPVGELCTVDLFFAFQSVCTVIEVDTRRAKRIVLGVRAGG